MREAVPVPGPGSQGQVEAQSDKKKVALVEISISTTIHTQKRAAIDISTTAKTRRIIYKQFSPYL